MANHKGVYIPLLPSPADANGGEYDEHGEHGERSEPPTDTAMTSCPETNNVNRRTKIALLIIVAITLIVSVYTLVNIDVSFPPNETSDTENNWSVHPAADKTNHGVMSGKEKTPEIDLSITPPHAVVNETEVFEAFPNDIEGQTRAKAELVDRKYCGKSPCHFTFLVHVFEQESKAQLHVKNWAFLSGILNRTFVLPLVYRSRLGACRRFPFSSYYSSSFMTSNAEFFSYITHADFMSWSREYPLPVTAQMVYLPRFPIGKMPANFSMDSLSGTRCIKKLQLDFDYSPYKNPVMLFHKETGNQKLMDTFKDSSITLGKSDETKGLVAKVLTIDSEYVWDPFVPNPAALIPLEYNAHWQNISRNIATQLAPYVAIHWRMETVPPANMPQCARDLAETIRGLPDISNVYLATDYPMHDEDGPPNSGTFHEVKPPHREAINILRKAFPNIVWSYLLNRDPLSEGWAAANGNVTADNSTSTKPGSTRARLFHRAPKGEIPVVVENEFDIGYLAIVDKLVCINADYFIAAPRVRCGRGTSSFTGQIIQMREGVDEEIKKKRSEKGLRVERRSNGRWEEVVGWQEAEDWLVFS